MSPFRSNPHALGKLFDAADRPIFVLDDELTIVFLNQACRQWLGGAAEALVGCKCTYQSVSASPAPEAVAAGLCPPPKVLAGVAQTALVFRAADEGRVVRRRARFLPLFLDEDEVLGAVGIVARKDLAEEEGSDDAAPIGEATAIELHECVERFHREAAGRYGADRLIGRGPAMRLARRQVEMAAAGDASVSLVGPPGSGRQHLAAAIHYASHRSATERAVLTPFDCPLLGEDLVEMFAAAVARRTTTLLLHRVDELSADVQVQLFDLLARRPPAWRLIATSAVPLLELARRGTFRFDLAALLSTLVIVLPPLVERREDLPLLAQLFVEDLNAAGSRQIGGFSPAALDRLDAHAWPGNLDELAEAVGEAHRRAEGVVIEERDLPDRLRHAARAAAAPRREDEAIVLPEYLGRVERELIGRALAKAKGNKARAARMLGVTRPKLYRRMVQLGLESP